MIGFIDRPKLGSMGILGLCLALMLVPGCDGFSGNESPQVRESGDVDLRDPAVAPAPNARQEAGRAGGLDRQLTAEPILTLGPEDPAGRWYFSSIAGAGFLPDARIAVVDGMELVVRVFRLDGTLERSTGSEGVGPEEFMSIRSVVRSPGGGVAIWDLRRRNVITIDPDGFDHVHVRVHLDGSQQPWTRFLGVASDGSAVMLYREPFVNTPEVDGTVAQRAIEILRVPHDGAPMTVPVAFEGRPKLLSRTATGGLASDPIPGTAEPAFVVLNDGLALLDPYTGVITVLDWSGSPVFELDISAHGAALDWRGFEPALSAFTEPHGRTTRARVEEHLPESPAKYIALHRDASQRYWVRPLPDPGRRDQEWRVFTKSGDLLASLRLPGDLEWVDALDDRLLLKRRFADGQERLEVYTMTGAGQ